MFPVPCVWRSSCRCARFGAPWLDRIAAAGARSRGWASPKRRFCASSWKTNGRAPESPAEGAVGAFGARRTPPQLTRPMLPMRVGSPCAGGPKRKRCRGGTVDHSGVGDEGCRPRGTRPPAAGPPGPCALRWEMLAHLLSSAPPTGVRIPVQGARNENGAGAAPLTIPGWAMRDVGRAGRGLPLRALRALARFAGRCSRISQAPRPQRGSNPCAGGTKRKRCRGGTVDHSGVGDEGCRPRGTRPPAAGPPGPCALRWEMLAHLPSSAPPTGFESLCRGHETKTVPGRHR